MNRPREKKKLVLFVVMFSFVLAFFVMPTIEVAAQSKPNNFEIGYNISQYQNDFGIGVHLISPYFIKSTVAIRVGANIQWLEHLDRTGTKTIWTTYHNFQLGLRGRAPIITDKIFIYGEGGIVTILPNRNFSTKSIEFGGYGLFGFEFRPNPKFAYFIELGGVGTGATADKIAGRPIYSNGFLTNVGFRIGL